MEQKQTRPPFFRSVRNYFREYCKCSSIHGFRYFGERRTYFERGWWFVVFALTLAGCVVMIKEVYQKWQMSPVIVSFATRQTPIYDVPFPAVTICPETKSKQKFYNHTKIVRKLIENKTLTMEERKLYDYMGLICKEKYGHALSQADTFDDDFFKQLINISSNNSLYDCSFMGRDYDCSTLFKPILTDEGICFTFNMLDRSEIYRDIVEHYENLHAMGNLTYGNWSMDGGYKKNAGVHPYPHRALLAGVKNSLTVHFLTSKENIDHTCKESIQGHRVLLHTPMRIPSLSKHYFMVPLNQVVLGNIQPIMITTSESVKLYHSEKRECHFPVERHLKFFKIYTSLNCKLECLTNFTLYHCGCVNFFMPRENTTKICGTAKLKCMKQAEDLLQMGTLYSKIDTLENKSSNSSDTSQQKSYRQLLNCDCLPICTDLTYDVEISQNDWGWINFFGALTRNGTFKYKEDDFHLSKLTLFFDSSQFITSQRNELYGTTAFWANFGGLLGLFTGFSVLSLMETIYFLTVRLCCNSKLYGYWAGREVS